MTIGVMGRKCGMTRYFDETGNASPVTVIQLYPNQKVTQIKTEENDGYESIQVSYGNKKATKLSKPLKGHYEKAKVEPSLGLVEYRTEISAYELGQELKSDWLSETQFVDVTAQSKGKGFAGTVKRHNFATQDATHGNSLSHRAPGSIGQNQTPGRVFKGKKMAGHMGAKKVSIQSLSVVKVDFDKGILLVKGGVPGAIGSVLLIKPAVKKLGVSNAS